MTAQVKIHSDQVVQIGRLQPYVNNPRAHSEEQIVALMGLIREFGFTNPVLVDEDFMIIAGHGRMVAAERLGMETVPYVMVRDLTPAQKRAYIIADNKAHELSSWDNDILASEFNFLYENNFDVALLGFEEDQAAYFLNGETIDDAEPEEELENDHPVPAQPGMERFSIQLEPNDKARLIQAIKDRKALMLLQTDAEALMSLLDAASDNEYQYR